MNRSVQYLMLRAEWWLAMGDEELDIEDEMRALKVTHNVGAPPRICESYGQEYGMGSDVQSWFCLLIAEAIK